MMQVFGLTTTDLSGKRKGEPYRPFGPLLHGPTGPISLKTVHWTVFRALNATAVGKLKKQLGALKSFPTAVGKYPRSGG